MVYLNWPVFVMLDQILHCLPLVQQILDIAISSEMEFLKFLDMYGMELGVP